MKKEGCKPEKATFNTPIDDAYGRCGSGEQALGILQWHVMGWIHT
jgi:hypothetical protein